MQKPYQILDENLFPVAEKDLSQNRAFLFGDGFFETIRVGEDGNIPLWSYHWSRILKSSKALQFDWPKGWTETAILNLIRNPEMRIHPVSLRVKLLFFRHASGAYCPLENGCRLFFEWKPLPQPWLQDLAQFPQVSETLYIQNFPFSWIKSTSALHYVMAGLERRHRGLDELILCDQKGNLVEGSYSFLCWCKNGMVFLPDQSLGGVDSVCRRYLEDFWRQQAIPFQMVKAVPQVLHSADWVAFGNALGVKVWPDTHTGKGFFPFSF